GASIVGKTQDTYKDYVTDPSEALLKAIDDAAIISQGKGTVGYEEAMQASYATAVANGSLLNYEGFEYAYYTNISQYNEQLQEMSELSLTELVERYGEFKDMLRIINDNVSVIKD
ncbi:MAG: hypothetical protein ACK5LZ_01905, partial [Anaerorhabdus sp.]